MRTTRTESTDFRGVAATQEGETPLWRVNPSNPAAGRLRLPDYDCAANIWPANIWPVKICQATIGQRRLARYALPVTILATTT